MHTKKIRQFILLLMLCIVRAEITESQYALMPELFYLENFDDCMLREGALFCTFVFQLAPLAGANSTVWNIIQNISSNPQNYRHDHLRHGICVSKSCTHDDTDNISTKEVIEQCYNKKYTLLGIKGNITKLTCQSNSSNYPVDIYDIAFGIVVIVYLIFVILASFHERLLQQKDKLSFYENTPSRTVKTFVAAFSIPKNWYRLTSTTSNPDYKKLKGIQGIRFYNMICVILSHTVMGVLAGPISNPQYNENSTKKVLNMFLANGWYVVQTFFVISGFLLGYHFFEMLEKNKNFKSKYFIWAVLNRYIRLVPGVAFMVALHGTWLVHISRGPNWDMFIGEEYRSCRKNWWTNMLFINNYVDNNNMCLHQSWYIAADMQLFIFSIFLLMIIWKYPAKLKYIFGIVLITGFLLPGILAYVNQYDIVVREYPEVLYNLNILRLEHWHVLYSSAYSNIFGYTTGIVFGYLFVKYGNQNLVVKKVQIVCWWILTFGIGISVILVAAIFYNPNFTVTPIKSALYWSFGKNLFAFAGAIFIYGLTQKIGWFARWFCEFQPVQVLGRLTYSAYIVHVAFIRLQMGYKRFPTSADDNMLFIAVLGDVVCAYLGATVLCLLVEMPVSALQKMLGLTTNSQKRKPNSSEKSLETLDVKCGSCENNTA